MVVELERLFLTDVNLKELARKKGATSVEGLSEDMLDQAGELELNRVASTYTSLVGGDLALIVNDDKVAHLKDVARAVRDWNEEVNHTNLSWRRSGLDQRLPRVHFFGYTEPEDMTKVHTWLMMWYTGKLTANVHGLVRERQGEYDGHSGSESPLVLRSVMGEEGSFHMDDRYFALLPKDRSGLIKAAVHLQDMSLPGKVMHGQKVVELVGIAKDAGLVKHLHHLGVWTDTSVGNVRNIGHFENLTSVEDFYVHLTPKDPNEFGELGPNAVRDAVLAVSGMNSLDHVANRRNYSGKKVGLYPTN